MQKFIENDCNSFAFVGVFTNKLSTPQQGPKSLENACKSFENLNTSIRDGKIKKEEAQVQLISQLNEIKAMIPQIILSSSKWAFPLPGYGLKAIGGKNGSGYISKGYDFFDGNKHGGHPAHDIFISDKNQDSKEDKTEKKVDVRSVLPGIVLASETEWAQDSNLRGGKYVMVFHAAENLISYYAHLDSVGVKTGQIVISGELIGQLGRTGLNAFKKRSPTHLHFMVLKFDAEKGLVPINPYKFLKY